MDHLDNQVLRTLCQWRSQGRGAILATVVRTWGSAPRPVGAIMAMRDDGAVVGSVSGGCIEDDLIHRHVHSRPSPEITAAAPRLVRYGIAADEAHRFGLPCGGTLELVLEFNPDAHGLHRLVQALEAGRLVQRVLDLADGQVRLVDLSAPAALQLSAAELRSSFGPAHRMLIIGAGALSDYLAQMALANGFRVTVCDPREEYHRGWSVDGAELLTEMPDDVVLRFRPDRNSCVVALTHDPKLDDLALLEALRSEAFYVGAIGSRRNNALRRARLVEHFDLGERQVARLHGPIGLFIGSRTPAEIAVSVMAEVLAVKNGVALPLWLNVGQAKAAAEAPMAPVCLA